MERAVELIASWIRRQAVPGLQARGDPAAGPDAADRRRGARAAGTTPCSSTVTSTSSRRWSPGARASGRGSPSIRDGRLYGRGASDDGYAAFAATTAIAALKQQGVGARAPAADHRGGRGERQPRPRASHRAARRTGSVRRASWSASTRDAATTSGSGARRRCAGIVAGTLARRRADRGRPLRRRERHRRLELPDHPLAALAASRTSARARSCRRSSTRRSRSSASRRRGVARGRARRRRLLEDALRAGAAGPIARDKVELILNRTWRPMLAVTGQAGLPSLESAGNVLRPMTSLEAVAPPSADASTRRTRPRALKTAARGGSALRRARDVRGRQGERRLGRAAARALAREVDRPRLVRRTSGSRRATSARAGRSRSWGCSGEQVPGGAVPRHGRARPALERARTERVPRDRDREEPHRCVAQVLADHASAVRRELCGALEAEDERRRVARGTACSTTSSAV